MKLLILATGDPSTQAPLVKAIKDAGHTADVIDPRNLLLYLSESTNGYDRIFDSSPNLPEPVRIKANDYDAVIPAIGRDFGLCISILRHLTQNLGLYSPQAALGLQMAHDKLWTNQVLSDRGVRIPLTMYAARPNHFAFIKKMIGGLPIVVKMLTGSQGNGVFIMETDLAATTTLNSLHKIGVVTKFQRFIKPDNVTHRPTDVRAIVVGDKVVSAMERKGASGELHANLSQGAEGRKIPFLSVEEEGLAVGAAKALGLEYAGVDLMRDWAGDRSKSYVIEVNGNPGHKIIDITKYNHFADLVKHIDRKVTASKATKEPEPTLNKDQAKIHNELISEYGNLSHKKSLTTQEASRLAFFRATLAKVGL